MPDHYEDLEQLRACFKDWDVELIQLGRSRSTAWACAAAAASVRVARVHAGRAVSVRGTGPGAHRCLLLSAAQDTPIRWLGRHIQPNQFAVLGRRSQIDLYLPSDATLCIITMDALARISTQRLHMRVTPSEHISRLLRCAETACNAGAAGDSSSLRAAGEALAAQTRIAIEASAVVPPRSGTSSLRTAAVARARRFVDTHLRNPISLADLCRHCGVGARTLEYGFRQFYDMTPIGFIKSQRLSRMRSALLRTCSQPVSIQKIATRLGFTHMGQFAQDYRILFGESPSTTLKRARQSRDAQSDRDGRAEIRT